MLDPLLGLTLGGCRLEVLLGKGGMGAVYRARHLKLDRPVAIKLLSPRLESDPEYVERFLREARAAASIDHPNVVQVLDVGEENGQHYIVLQFVDGENLEALLEREGRLSVDRATGIVIAVSEGLRALHARGIIHRDIKPANILMGLDDSVRITDFGLAHNQRLESRMTSAGMFMGTPEYVAPEQVRGTEVDARTDLYALGVCYYRMLSGELPFKAVSAMDMATQQIHGQPTPLGKRVPEADPRTVALIARLLEKEPAARFQSAEELLEALETPGAAKESGAGTPVPEIAIRGRRVPPPPADAVSPARAAESPPVISAGPRKRVIQGGPIVPREIVPIPPPPKKPTLAPVEPPAPPPPPPPSRLERPVMATPAKPAVQTRRAVRKGSRAAWMYWPLITTSCSLMFATGVGGALLRTEGFWEGLPKPLYQGVDLPLRLALAAGSVAAWIAACWFNRKALQSSSVAGASLMLPFFGALCFYAAGFSSPLEGTQGPQVLRALRGTVLSLVHPVMLGPLGLWLLLAGLAAGRAVGGVVGRSVSGIFVLAGLAGLWAFSGRGDLAAAWQRLAAGQDLPTAGASAAVILGCWMNFGGVNKARKILGALIVLISSASVALAGPPLSGMGETLAGHGIAFFLGIFLLYWSAWFLYTKAGGD